MLAASPLRTSQDDFQGQGESTMAKFSIVVEDDFPDFTHANLLDSIDFDDLFIGIHDGDILPDLEMDSEILAEFSPSREEDSDVLNISTATSGDQKTTEDTNNNNYLSKKEGDRNKSSESEKSGASNLSQGEEVASKANESVVVNSQAPNKEANNNATRKPPSQSKNNNPQGKRKVKVDWTPELHRRFVQAVEQLGVDKAVPSRILELMGIDCLTRHNIASHLQKYRSHRKHLLAREAETASWSQRRQMYGTTAAAVAGVGKRDASPWLAPAPATIGFPPVTTMPTQFRPLHVWGHPTTDNSMANMWPPKHMTHSPSPIPPPVAPAWAPMTPHHPLTPVDASNYWLHPPRPLHRFVAPPVPGVPPQAMYKVDPRFSHPATSVAPQPQLDVHPSKESVDAAIGDVLSKPWLPLPLGLKPPSLDGVMGELQRQGVPKIPPSCA